MKHRPLSKKLIDAVQLSPIKKYKLAKEAGLHQSHFSQILNGIVLTRVGDNRVLKVAELVGVPANESYEPEAE